MENAADPDWNVDAADLREILELPIEEIMRFGREGNAEIEAFLALGGDPAGRLGQHEDRS